MRYWDGYINFIAFCLLGVKSLVPVFLIPYSVVMMSK